MVSRRRALVIVLLAVAAGAIGLVVWLNGAGDPPAERPVTVQMSWRHEATYAGFHAADQMGAYSAAGLKVTFLPGSVKTDPIAPVVDGEADQWDDEQHLADECPAVGCLDGLGNGDLHPAGEDPGHA